MTSYCANGGICSQGASQDFATFELDAAIPRQGARQVDDMVAAGQGLGSKHMKYRRWMHGAKFWLGALLSVAYPALAVGIVIVDARDARDAQLRNLSQAQLTTVASGRAQRSAAPAPRRWRRSTACRATCRFHAAGRSSFQIVWPAGPTETLRIVDPTSTVGAQPMRGTQVVVPRRNPGRTCRTRGGGEFPAFSSSTPLTLWGRQLSEMALILRSARRFSR